MTKAQITKCLQEFEYTDYSNPQTLDGISVIILEQDNRLYPDKYHYRYIFDMSNEILEIYNGYVENDTFIYEINGSSTKPDRSNHMISFASISAFCQLPKINEIGQIEYRN